MHKRIMPVFFLFIFSYFSYGQDLPTIAVFDFSHSEQFDKDSMSSITSLLSSEIFKSGRYTIIDAKQRDTLIEEMKFSLTGLSDEASLLNLGELLQAELIVIGEIGSVGKRIVLNCRMLETETAKIQNTADGIYENLDDLLDDIPRIASVLSNGGLAGQSIEETTDPLSDWSSEGEPVHESRRYKTMGFVTLGTGIVLIGTGSYFLIDSIIKLRAVNQARSDYDNATSNFDALYDDYLEKFDDAEGSNARFWVGTGLIGAGIASGVLSAVFFSKEAEQVSSTMSFAITPVSFHMQIAY